MLYDVMMLLTDGLKERKKEEKYQIFKYLKNVLP